MKRYFFTINLVFILSIGIITTLAVSKCHAQDGEFAQSKNGLIYADSTVAKLKRIVDSLNLKFKVCELNKTYRSKPQGKAHFVSIDTGNAQQAKLDMNNNIPYSDFLKKYPQAKSDEDLLVVKFNYKDYNEKDVLEISSISFGNKSGHELNFDKNLINYNKPLKGRWLYKYYDNSEYSKASVDAFYITEDFSTQSLPETYAKMVQYGDCLVDTGAQIFYDDARKTGGYYFEPLQIAHPKLKAFNAYEDKAIKSMKANSAHFNSHKAWMALKFSFLDSLHKYDKKFNSLLAEAAEEVLKKGGGSDDFEEYVGRYCSKKTELELKRHRMVIGNCSQDDSPRVHALRIAKLSAETVNWEIFLRSHLDIMNDRFERVSDGSYAWGRRKTYIKELEVLDINVLDLLVGTSLRLENPASNHYYGNISRLGRALAETSNAEEIETKMLGMINDNELDDYNRILTYYLFLNYNQNLDSAEKQTLNEIKLAKAVQNLPAYIVAKISKGK